ncbi:hypothetical protein IJI18_03510 [Candidatus Saccharibacteria bacterium]|nr:hypothetical protein [Candidatus Saccharibacteria bacterium]
MKVKHFITTCGILMGGLATAQGASAVITYEKSSDVQFTFDPVLSLTLTGQPTGFSYPGYLISNLAPGNTAVSNTVNVKVDSTSSAGWRLAASVGGTSKETPATSYSGTDLTLSGGGDSFAMIASGTSSLSAGKWGYTLDGGTTYMDLPDSTGTAKTINMTADYAGNPASASYAGDTSGDGTDTQIGAYAKTTQVSGSYKNVVNFAATANIPARQVTVAAGTNVASVSLDGSTTTLTKTVAEGDTVDIEATCSGDNIFAGWGLSADFGSFASKTSASTTYTVGRGEVTITAYCGYYIMQNMTASMCPTTPTVAVDNRDNHEYIIQKLADGNCWMLDNLDLDLTSSTVVANLNEDNTNASSTALSYMRNGGGSATDQWAKDGLLVGNWGGSYSYSQPLVNRSGVCQETTQYMCLYPYQKGTYGGQTYDGVYTNATMIDKYGSPTDTTTGEGVATTTYNVGPGSYKIGTYYNYCAASAGSYCYGDGTSGGSSAAGNATYDICPSGWRMPTGGSGGEYATLATAIPGRTAENTSSFQAQLSTPVSGTYNSGSAYRQGYRGSFWSSTYSGSDTMYDLAVGGTAINQQGAYYRSGGESVRCILFAS